MPDNSGAVDLGSLSNAEQERLAAMAEEHPEGSYPGDKNPGENKRKVLTAFIVLVGYDGNPEVAAFEDETLLVQTQPTNDLVSGACHTIIKDLTIQEQGMFTAHATHQVMMQKAREMAEQQQAAHLAQNLGDLRGRG